MFPILKYFTGVKQSPLLKQAILRNKQVFEWKQLNFVDILDVFKEEPINKRSLKLWFKRCFKRPQIRFDKDCMEEDMDGRIALLEAVDAMNKFKTENLVFSEMDVVKSIEKYNYVDVKVIDEIVDYLRTKI